MQQTHNRETLKTQRRELRHSLTPAEAALWKSLRRSQLCGKKFRRQHSVGPYILDFYCPEFRLAVELDGQAHFNPPAWEHDCDRTEYLNRLNVRVLRFENRDVFENLDWVLREISTHLTAPPEPASTPEAEPVTTPEAGPVTTPEAEPATTPEAEPATTAKAEPVTTPRRERVAPS
jgi:very-short-patch-repair endonuclease